MIKIKTVASAEDINFCAKAILAFRPMLNAETLVEQTLHMISEGFRLICVPNESNTEAAAIAGFRTFEMYRTGKIIYIDDLFTFAECRGKGYAGILLDYIHFLAHEAGIQTVHLDSGYGLHPAHRLYLNKGYVLSCLHFTKTISSE